MGTRAVIYIHKNMTDKPFCAIYRQMDGMPDNLGMDIFRALNEGQINIVNGYMLNQYIPDFFNGMSCLAAYLVGALKEGIGSIYLEHPDKDFDYVDYKYYLSAEDESVQLQIFCNYDKSYIFSGLLKDFKEWNDERNRVQDDDE